MRDFWLCQILWIAIPVAIRGIWELPICQVKVAPSTVSARIPTSLVSWNHLLGSRCDSLPDLYKLSLSLSTSCFYVGCPGTEVHILCNNCCQFLHPSSLGFNSHHWHLDYELVARHLWWNSLSIIATLTWTLSLSHLAFLFGCKMHCLWVCAADIDYRSQNGRSSRRSQVYLQQHLCWVCGEEPAVHTRSAIQVRTRFIIVVWNDCYWLLCILQIQIASIVQGCYHCMDTIDVSTSHTFHLNPPDKGWLSFEHTKQLLSVIIIVSYLTCSFIQLNPALSLIVMKPWNWWTNCACLIAKLDVGFSWNWQVWAFQRHPRSVCEDLAVVWELLQQMTNLGGCLSNNWSGSHHETTHSFHLIFWDSWKSAQIHLLDGLIFVYSSLFSVMLQQWDVDSCRCCHGFL